MNYSYYPGCSLQESAVEYDVSTRAVLEAMDVGVEEIPGWTCCGASAVEAVSELLATALPARNLALAARHIPDTDVLVPCSACYLNLLHASMRTKVPLTRATVNGILKEEELALESDVRVRHLLDVFANDLFGLIEEKVARPLEGLRVAPYYGCQILRPYAVFDDPERPQSMNRILTTLGVEIFPWDMGAKCCGASLMASQKNVALRAVGGILQSAAGADVIVTVCPLCQMNLEGYQEEALKNNADKTPVSVLYLPQLIGLAFGLPGSSLQLQKNMVVSGRLASLIAETATA